MTFAVEGRRGRGHLTSVAWVRTLVDNAAALAAEDIGTVPVGIAVAVAVAVDIGPPWGLLVRCPAYTWQTDA